MIDLSSISEETRQEELIPTIIIGLGGTGKIALARLKARFYQRFGGRLPATVRLLCMDIDPKEEYGRVDSQIVKLGTEEFLDLGDVNVKDIKRQLSTNKFPEIDAWFDRGLSLAEGNLRKGAQQNRQLGRLAFFWKLGDVREALLSAIGQVTKQGLTAEAGRPDIARPVEVNVFIISSTCGGTGSGMVIDVAYVLKDLFERRGMGDLVSMIGVLVSPLVFRAANQDNIQPNAFAALQELDYFMTGRAVKTEGSHPQIEYPGGYQVDCAERPFKICYLIDAVASSGRTLEGIENLAPMLIDGVFLQVGSRLGISAASLINNVKSLNIPELRTVYSSFGVASLIFPAQQIIEICASRVAQDVLGESILYEPSDTAKKEISVQVGRFLDNKDFSLDALIRRLNKDERGALVIGRLKDDERLRDTRLRNVEKSQVYAYVTGRVQELSTDYDAKARRHLDTQQTLVLDDFLRASTLTLEWRVQEIVSNRDQGLPHGIAFLTALRVQLDETWQALERMRAGAETQRGQAESRRRLAQEKFEGDVKSSLRNPFRKPDRSRDDYIAAAQAYLDRDFELNTFVRAKQIVASLMDEVTRLLERLNALRDNLAWVRDSFLVEQERVARRALLDLDVVRRKPIIDPSRDIDSLYTHFRSDARFRTLDDLVGTAGGLWGLVSQRREAIAEHVLGVAKKAFELVNQIRLEDVILEKAGITEPDKRRVLPRDLLLTEAEKYEEARWLETLRANAEYFWNYNEAMERARGHAAEYIMITGVQDTQNTIFSNIATHVGEGLASTDDPHLMTVLQMIHGFTFDSMSQYRTYLESYIRARKRGDAVYVFPQFSLGNTGTRRLFIRAHALGTLFEDEDKGRGLITWRDGQYVLMPMTDGEPPTPLGDGTLKDALQQFARQTDVQAEVRKRVESAERALRPQKADFVGRVNQQFVETFTVQLGDDEKVWGEELLALLQEHVRRL